MDIAIEEAVGRFCGLWPEGTFPSFPFNVMGLLAVLLVCLTCGGVGSLVVGNRMAFFSDALAHSAFAGVALGLMLGLLTGAEESHVLLLIMPIMVAFGVLVGLLIAFVREKSGQASDTVIGVFFALAIGLGALLLKAASSRRLLPPEDFLFGNLVNVRGSDLLILLVLTAVTGAVLVWKYNQIVFTSFSPNLALSRQIPTRLCNYLLVVLLAVIVNICLKAVGVLLINALLVVPAAAAANLCRNMRQLFRVSILLCLLAGVGGQLLSWQVMISTHTAVSEGGMIVVLSVVLFALSMLVGPLRRRGSARRSGTAQAGLGEAAPGRRVGPAGEPARGTGLVK
jgi:zinc transport system permease protein